MQETTQLVSYFWEVRYIYIIKAIQLLDLHFSGHWKTAAVLLTVCLFHQSGLFRYFYVIFLSMSAAFHSSLFLLVTLLSKSTFKLSTLCIFEMQKKFSQYCLNTGSCYIVVYLFDFRISLIELLWWCFFLFVCFVLFCFVFFREIWQNCCSRWVQSNLR